MSYDLEEGTVTLPINRFTAKYNIMNMAFEKRTLLYKRILFISGMTELRQLPHP